MWQRATALVGFWLLMPACLPRLDPAKPSEAALVQELAELAIRCGQGDLGESDIEGFPAFASDRDFLQGRAGITRTGEMYDVAATFDNGVTIASSFGTSRGNTDFRPPDTIVTWPSTEGATRRVCGSANSAVGVRAGTNTPFLFVVDVVGEGDDCQKPLTGRIRVCF